MKVQEFYDIAVRKGMEADFRGQDELQKILARRKQKEEKLSAEDREELDQESFTNPYADTRILHVAQDGEVRKAMVGIDIGVGELLLARDLGCDLVVAHHPLGRAYADLHEVMDVQADILHAYGVPINVAEAMMAERMSEVARGINPRNHWREVDAAKLLGLNLMCVHTATDNISAKSVRDEMEAKKPERVEDVFAVLRGIKEYQEAIRRGVGPRIFSGKPENRAGRIFVGFTGGTESSPKIYQKMAEAGIGTVIDMHASEEHKKEAESLYLNVIIAGHMPSDSIGMNALADELERQGAEVVPAGGFFRV